MITYTATYSPEDNKLRLYASARLPEDVYRRVRAAGFIWAPKQELFVAPAWTPDREDLLTELAGEIGDEDTSLVERAEQRAERFEDYSEKRAAEADRAHDTVSAIADNIPLGQPILVGHHSERRARKDAEKIENGMRRAVNLWKTSEYWKDRAAGALSHAKYKELPAVRARRIKTIEADKRRQEKAIEQARLFLKLWADDCAAVKKKDGGATTFLERARYVANRDHVSRSYPLDKYPRQPGASQYEGPIGLWSALGGNDGVPIITPEQAREIAERCHNATIAWAERWIEHYNHRLEYERAMLGESGGLAAEKFDIRPGGQVLIGETWCPVLRVNRKAGAVLSVTVVRRYGGGAVGIERVKDYRPPTDEQYLAARKATKLPPLCNYPGDGFLHQTQAEYNATVPKWSDFPKTLRIGKTETTAAHRVRANRPPDGSTYRAVGVFLTDAKRKDPPTAETEPAPKLPEVETDLGALQAAADRAERRRLEASQPNKFEQLESALRGGVKVVSANQLFPTPRELARRLASLADIQPGQRVLEPSAGTGSILRAIVDRFTGADCGRIVAVEINQALVVELLTIRNKTIGANSQNYDVRAGDFLACNSDLGEFDRIVMNPPFENGADIRHIQHAVKFLKPGGKLAAICANGPRQRAALQPISAKWFDLEPGAFAESGTNVNAAMLLIEK